MMSERGTLNTRLMLFMLLLAVSFQTAHAQQAASTIPITRAVALRMPLSGRTPLYKDPVAYRLASGVAVRPVEGESLEGCGARTDCTWKAVTTNPEGVFEGQLIGGGYLYASVEVTRPTIMILEASGHGMVYVNGAPRSGDVYDYGWARLPVMLRKGRNDLLFQTARGRLKARLVAPEGPATLTAVDPTLPDVVTGESRPLWGAIRVVNAADKPLTGMRLRTLVAGTDPVDTDLPVVGPLTSRKVGFQFAPGNRTATGKLPVVVQLVESRRGRVVDQDTVELDVVGPTDRIRRTFTSEIDGSVQYYVVVTGGTEPGKKPALFLSLHGASVEGINQARAYNAKSWGHIVTPTNRRPYGFDWEDWGRLDALEVLAQAKQTLDTDPLRTYLTGHSMGGHGTWINGVTYPDQFAAIAPICGWYYWWSYGMKMPENPTTIEKAILRATNMANTLGLSRNFMNHGIYIMHGGKDETVPVQQARFMKQLLAPFHKDFSYYEWPEVGHWWSNESVDFAPIFDYFHWHRRKTLAEQDTVRFTTASPGVSSSAYWAEIYGQQKPLEFSTITLVRDSARSRIEGTTENVSRLAIALSKLAGRDTVTLALDGKNVVLTGPATRQERVWLSRTGDEWAVSSRPAPSEKSPQRYGTFKDAWRHRFVLVYGTKGTKEENQWAYDKARYDAETFWYRGNGSVDVVADVDFDPNADPDRGVILIGNATTNAAWNALLADSPVQVTRGAIRMGNRTFEGPDFGTYFVRPRPGSDVASVGVIAGTGLAGMKAAEPNQYFKAGAGFPDLLIFSTDMLNVGEAGLKAFGYFGPDWSLERGEWLFP